MRSRPLLFLLVSLSVPTPELAPARPGPASLSPETLSFPAFGRVMVYAPHAEPRAVVLFVSGDGGWNLGVVGMAERLRDEGALVVGIDIRSLLRGLDAAGGLCAYPAGDLEELARAVQLRHRLRDYARPILVGYSSGATLVYGALVQAPPETFAGAISLGFCPDLQIRKPLCAGRRLVFQKRTRPPAGYQLAPAPGLAVPWEVFQGDIDQVCDPAGTRAFVGRVPSGRLVWLPKVGHGFSVVARWMPQFVEAFHHLAVPPSPPPRLTIEELADLPLTEVQATGAAPGSLMAVILTGDGGWAEIDKGIAAGLAAHGVPVIGWSSLRYYWTPRTPEEASADLARLLRHALAAWGKQSALLVGYSFGADVLPFLVKRLPPELRARVAEVALLGLSERASFEFHVLGWLGAETPSDRPTRPEVEGLRGVRVLCLQGEDEKDSACRGLREDVARVVTLPGGHHFGGDYAGIAGRILEAEGSEATR